MAYRQKIFLAYCCTDKKWLDRVQEGIAPPTGAGNIVVWDERRFRSRTWRAELPELLAISKVAVMLVSDLFLKSNFITRGRLPALLDAARSDGLVVCWVLVSHCLYETAGLDKSLALNDLDWPLDGLSATRRDAVVVDLAVKIRKLTAGESLTDGGATTHAVSLMKTSSCVAGGAEAEGSPISPYVLRLGAVIETRVETVLKLRRLMRWLFMTPLAFVIASIPLAVGKENLSLLVLIAGFGVFIASLALVLKTRVELIGQSVICVRCVRTGLADDSLPGRQRATFAQRAQEILGEI